MLKALYNDESGAIIAAEMVLVLTIAVLGMVVGITAVRDAVSQELNDISCAIGAISQTYSYTGISKAKDDGVHARIDGSSWVDHVDDCDCQQLNLLDVGGETN